MTHEEFKTIYIGKYINRVLHNGLYVDVGTSASAQCMSLSNHYVCLVYGYPVHERSPLGASYAYQSFQNSHSDFVKIDGNDISKFQKGDIIYWDLTLGNKAGHVAIFDRFDGDGFISIDQNWPEGSPVHEQRHDIKSVCGVLRHKSMIKQEKPKNKKRMMNIVKTHRAVWYKLPGEYTAELYVVVKKKDDEGKEIEVRRVVADSGSNFCLVMQLFGQNGALTRINGGDAIEEVLKIPEGQPYFLAEHMRKHPELFELQPE